MKQKFQIGDIVILEFSHMANGMPAEVIEYDLRDNKRINVRLEDGTERSWVSANCKIIKKIK